MADSCFALVLPTHLPMVVNHGRWPRRTERDDFCFPDLDPAWAHGPGKAA